MFGECRRCSVCSKIMTAICLLSLQVFVASAVRPAETPLDYPASSFVETFEDSASAKERMASVETEMRPFVWPESESSESAATEQHHAKDGAHPESAATEQHHATHHSTHKTVHHAQHHARAAAAAKSKHTENAASLLSHGAKAKEDTKPPEDEKKDADKDKDDKPAEDGDKADADAADGSGDAADDPERAQCIECELDGKIKGAVYSWSGKGQQTCDDVFKSSKPTERKDTSKECDVSIEDVKKFEKEQIVACLEACQQLFNGTNATNETEDKGGARHSAAITSTTFLLALAMIFAAMQ